MGQNWDVFNPDRCQRIGPSKLGEEFFEHGARLYKFIRVLRLPPELDKWLNGGRIVSQPGRFATLPEDILHSIFEHPDFEFSELVVIASTCKSLLIAAMPILQSSLQDIHAPWAKCRIIYLGEYTQDDDKLPAGFLTEAEKHEAAITLPPVYEGFAEHSCYTWYASEYYEPVLRLRRTLDDYYDRLRFDLPYLVEKRTVDPSTRAQDLALIEVLCNAACEPTCEAGESVLFNLSKGECVREGGLRPMVVEYERFRVLHYIRLTLGHALASRICWSTDWSCSMYLEGWLAKDLAQGAWAGDRFCIATMGEMPLTPEGEAWKDVTAEVDAFLWHVWRHHNMGDPLCEEEFRDVPGGDPATAAEREEEEAEAEEAAREAEEAERADPVKRKIKAEELELWRPRKVIYW